MTRRSTTAFLAFLTSMLVASPATAGIQLPPLPLDLLPGSPPLSAPKGPPPSKPTLRSVIVKPRKGVTSFRLSERFGLGKRIGNVRRLGAKVFRVQGDPARIAERLERSSLVAYAEPNEVVRAAATPNDSLFGHLYGLNNFGQEDGLADADVDAPEGWDAAGIGTFPATGGVTVGVIDSGVQHRHEDLAGKVASCAPQPRKDMVEELLGLVIGGNSEDACADGNGHGTAVAGVIAAGANNGTGVAGVAFNSQLAVCKALGGPMFTGSTAGVANCITWAHDSGSKVISMSLVAPDSTTLKEAIDYAWKNGSAAGSVLVAAAGNDGNATQRFPAAYPNVISVGATDNRDRRAFFSNANSDVEISAPGVNVLSTSPGGYGRASGTSMATPHVAGAAALIWSRVPGATAAQVVGRLDAATDDLGPPGRDPAFGFGRLNLLKAAGG
jgi:thermitase